MTTIAYDSITVCGDGLVTCEGVVMRRDGKKIRVAHGCIFALTGNMCMFDALIDWIAGGAEPDKAPKVDDKDWAMLVVDRDGARRYQGECPYPDPVPALFADGSGRDLARGAMFFGATAREAVAIACAYDIGTGGDIQVIDIQEALGLNQTREAAE